MSRLPTLTVVVPDFTDSSTSIRARPDVLYARLAGRGSVQRKWEARDAQSALLMPWQRGLLEALRLDERSHPSGPLTAYGAGLDLERSWLHAELVHLAAGLNDVAIVSLQGEHAVTLEERAALLDTLRSHVNAIALTLEATTAGDFLLGSTQALEVQTVTPQYARTQEWNDALPRGKDAASLRRLMTEFQMLLHEHPVNAARARRGAPTANAVWFWGNGQPNRQAGTNVRHCIGDNEYLAGLCRCEGWEAPRALADLEQALELSSKTEVVIVLGVHASPDAQLQVVSIAAQAIATGRFSALDLVLDEWHVNVGRWALKKFWRAPRVIERWAQA